MHVEPIPFLDLRDLHGELEGELMTVFREALHAGRFIGGTELDGFEREFAKFCKVTHCAGVGNGTDALRFALMALGVTSGSVVTVPNTFIATTEAISQAGAIPEFVDIESDTQNLDPKCLARFLRDGCDRDEQGCPISRLTGRRVRAVVAVHLYGQPAAMDQILALAEEFGLPVVEDAAQAHGAEYFSSVDRRWHRVGGLARVAAFSFYPGKNLGACGEAGAVTTNDPEIDKKVRMLRDHGQARKYVHEFEGYNGRLDAIQAGILRVKLRKLVEWTASRRQCAVMYGKLLRSCRSLVLPVEPSWAKSVYHLYVIRSSRRQELVEHLNSAGVGSGLHYPIPLHLQKAYRYLGLSEGSFPVAERAAKQVLSLPMFPGLQPSQQERVAQQVLECETQAIA